MAAVSAGDTADVDEDEEEDEDDNGLDAAAVERMSGRLISE